MRTVLFFILLSITISLLTFFTICQAEECGKIVSYQCPHLNQGQSYYDNELIDLAGDAVSINPDDPASWVIDLRLRDARKLLNPVYLKATSPYYDQPIKRWGFTCYPPGSTAYSTIKIIKTKYSKCFIEPTDKHFITCYLPTRCP